MQSRRPSCDEQKAFFCLSANLDQRGFERTVERTDTADSNVLSVTRLQKTRSSLPVGSTVHKYEEKMTMAPEGGGGDVGQLGEGGSISG